MDTVNKNVQVDTTDSEAKLDELESRTEEAKLSVDEVVVEAEGADIKGLESASHRVIRMIPGLREAQRIQRSIGMLSEGSVMGGLGLLLVAYSIYRQISSMLAEQQQQRDEYQQMIMNARGFTTSAQVTTWEEGQRRARENDYIPGIIP